MSIPTSRSDYSVLLLASDWLTVDAALDSLAYSLRSEGWDVEEGDEEHEGQHPYWRSWLEFTEDIRRAGADRLPERPSDPQELATWPPLDLRIEIELSEVQWQLVISALNDSATVSSRLGNHDEAADTRGVAREITTELKGHGWQPLLDDINPLHSREAS
ncbi:hypothetical protein [Actinoplanes aureus]|uniref:Uncharacterized protein n=1 Tax=Actinoplanes aureus TaxID=2792083 RepID=A0A931CFQ3_9ACTN|nr:hypothetical protein [Actinoplanes aureus]MBG0566391.1 hypothetical protein [Actinoplanes aureus]